MDLTADVVRRLVADQHPQWAGLPVVPVPRQGHDNRTFRLGDELSVRLPSAAAYVAGVTKEDRFLALLGRHLSLAVPEPVATGEPGSGYPYPWSVRRWLPGDTPDHDPALDRTRLALDLGRFLRELRAVPAGDGPLGGAHSFHRGCHPSAYGDEVQEELVRLEDRADVEACWAIWSDAVGTAWGDDPVWFHGDLAPGNLLTVEGRLHAVIDFGTCGVGDPACDLVMAWTFFGPDERAAFAEAVALPDDVWSRARGWALWKALVTSPDSPLHPDQTRSLAALIAERRGR